MASTTTTTLDDLFTSIVREAIFTAQESSLVRNLVTTYDISGDDGKAIQVPVYPEVSAAALTEGSDMSSTAVSTSSVTITAAEVGVQAVLTDLAAKSSARNIAADLGKVLGEAVAKKMDEDLIALFDGFSTSVGSAGTELITSYIFNAAAQLDNASAPGQKYCVLHPYQAYNLKANLTNTFANPNGGDLQNEAMRNGYVGRIAGVDIFESANITVDGSDDAKGGLFAQEALHMVLEGNDESTRETDESRRTTEYGLFKSWGEAERADPHGVEMYFDAAATV